jgi:hypothetical protein
MPLALVCAIPAQHSNHLRAYTKRPYMVCLHSKHLEGLHSPVSCRSGGAQFNCKSPFCCAVCWPC